MLITVPAPLGGSHIPSFARLPTTRSCALLSEKRFDFIAGNQPNPAAFHFIIAPIEHFADFRKLAVIALLHGPVTSSITAAPSLRGSDAPKFTPVVKSRITAWPEPIRVDE